MTPKEAVDLPLPCPVFTIRSERSLLERRRSRSSRDSLCVLPRVSLTHRAPPRPPPHPLLPRLSLRSATRLAHATRLLSTSCTRESARKSSRRRHRAPKE